MSTIDITFTGLASGSFGHYDEATNTNDPGFFHNLPYIADFRYNTDIGTLTPTATGFHLDGGLISATINIGNFGAWAGPYYKGGLSYLDWTTDLSHVLANAGGTYYHLVLTNDLITYPGSFQFGQCPTSQGGPCGYTTSAAMTFTVVPAPIVGSGISSLILTLLLVRSIQWLTRNA